MLLILLLCLAGSDDPRQFLFAQGNSDSSAILNRPAPHYLTDRNFRQALTQPLSAAWSNVSIRAILQRISETQQISILLDRRIDPTLKLKVDLQNQTLESGLTEIAEQVQAGTAVVGSNIYMGPNRAVSTLKTLLELKKQELFQLSEVQPSLNARVSQLSRKKTFHFQDLDTPADLLQKITTDYQLTISNPERIPHDLWPHGTLASVNANEALSLVLNQLELTYLWEKQGTAIRLLSIPERVTVLKTYSPPRGKSLAETSRQLKQAFPDTAITISGKTIQVDAAADIQEQIEEFLNPSRKSTVSPPVKTVDAVPIQRRKFTLRVKKVPVLAVMQKLEQSGIEFDYQQQELTQAGVDLTQRIDISVNNANADEFLSALFGPLHLSYEISGLKVSLKPEK